MGSQWWAMMLIMVQESAHMTCTCKVSLFLWLVRTYMLLFLVLFHVILYLLITSSRSCLWRFLHVQFCGCFIVHLMTLSTLVSHKIPFSVLTIGSRINLLRRSTAKYRSPWKKILSQYVWLSYLFVFGDPCLWTFSPPNAIMWNLKVFLSCVILLYK